jgi:hypothetical protein
MIVSGLNPKLSLTNDNFARRADNSFYTNELSGLTPTLKLSGNLTLNKKAKSLSFNACPVQPCRGRPGGKKKPNGFFGLKRLSISLHKRGMFIRFV